MAREVLALVVPGIVETIQEVRIGKRVSDNDRPTRRHGDSSPTLWFVEPQSEVLSPTRCLRLF